MPRRKEKKAPNVGRQQIPSGRDDGDLADDAVHDDVVSATSGRILIPSIFPRLLPAFSLRSDLQLQQQRCEQNI